MAGKEEEMSVELVRTDDAVEVAHALAGLADFEPQVQQSTEDARLDIVMQMLSAETEEDLWKELPRWSSKDSIGKTFRVTDARLWKSKFVNESGKQGAFLSCPAVDLETGEVGILNTSAIRLASRILWYKMHGGLFPLEIEIVSMGDTAKGYPIIDARKLEGAVASVIEG